MEFDNPKMARDLAGAVFAVVVVIAAAYFWINRPATVPTDVTSTDVFMSKAENREAWYDHRAVAVWVASCLGVHSPENLPEAVRWSLEPPGRFFSNWTEEKPVGDLTSQHRAVIGLSNALFMERTDSVERLSGVSQSLEKFQVSAIIIGLLTTVFISLSSTDIIKDSNAALTAVKITVKIFAIVLPAVGTAVAALNTFYDPKSEQIRYGRMSESSGLLHRQIALEISNLPCASADPKDSAVWGKNAIRIDSWINAHKALLSPSTQKTETPATADNSGLPGGSGGSPTQSK